MMVGMIGEELRMQGDAFSDNVNLTSRLEGLNKFYGTSMIISQDILDQLPQPVTFGMRYLGKAVVKGRVAPLAGEPARIAAHWEATTTPQRALPWLRRAADRANAAMRPREGVEFLVRAECAGEVFAPPPELEPMYAGAVPLKSRGPSLWRVTD